MKCAYLNFFEAVSWTGFPLLGCWHPHVSRGEEEGLAFTTFVPNALYQPMIATNLALGGFAKPFGQTWKTNG